MTEIAQGEKPNTAYTLEDMANDSAGLLDARRIDKAHMVCASLGGAIGQLVAANHRENAIVRLNHLLNREQRAAAANITGSELIEIPSMGHDPPAALHSRIADAIESVAKRARVGAS